MALLYVYNEQLEQIKRSETIADAEETRFLQRSKSVDESRKLEVEVSQGAVEDEQERAAWKNRKTFQLLLMGQGGSGKTAIVQEIVLPAIDFLFPPTSLDGRRSALIVCDKWPQAENISKGFHQATSCHRASASSST